MKRELRLQLFSTSGVRPGRQSSWHADGMEADGMEALGRLEKFDLLYSVGGVGEGLLVSFRVWFQSCGGTVGAYLLGI